MVIKLYISGISGNKEVKKKQQRVQMILDSKQINYEAIDITEPGKEKDKEFMQQNGKVRESLGKYPLPPQIFNDDDFCGDYEDFDMANEVDELEKFLHIETKDIENGSKQNGKTGTLYDKNKDSTDSLYNPYEYHTFTLKYGDVNGLKEEITNINSLIEEKERTEEMTESEVNGETESAPALEPSNESVETSADAAAPEKEESTAENETAAAENEKEENAEDEEKQQEAEMPEKEEENEEADNPKEEKVESSEKSEEKEKEKEEEEEEEGNEEEKEEEIAEDVESKEKIINEEEEIAEDVESKEKIINEEEESEPEKSQEE